jgi:hypothetical protein
VFAKILGKVKGSVNDEDKEHQELVDKISKMNLTDMRTYVNNKVPDFSICENGLNEIMHKLIDVDEKSSKRYINIDDMDSKIKKGFDLVLIILKNKKITVTTIESVDEFLELSREIVEKYDKEHKQIYGSKFKDALSLAVEGINIKAQLQRKMSVIGS